MRILAVAALLALSAFAQTSSPPADATPSRRGLVSIGTQRFGGLKIFDGGIQASLTAGSSLLGVPFCSAAPDAGQVLGYTGGQWCSVTAAGGTGITQEMEYESIWIGLGYRAGYDGVTTLEVVRRFEVLRLWQDYSVTASAEPFLSTPTDVAGGQGHLVLIINDGMYAINIPSYIGSGLSLHRAIGLAPGQAVLFIWAEPSGLWHEVMRSPQGYTGSVAVGADAWTFVDGILLEITVP